MRFSTKCIRTKTQKALSFMVKWLKGFKKTSIGEEEEKEVSSTPLSSSPQHRKKKKSSVRTVDFHAVSSQFSHLVHNGTTPLATRNLHSSTHRQPNARVSEQRSVGTRVQTQVKVEVGAVLVGSLQAILRAQRVARSRAQVGDLDDDAVACIGQFVARAVGLSGQLPAGAAAGAGACSGADAKSVLG